MGAPSAPSIVQQQTAPTKDEKQAAQDALDQKKAALTKIRQDIFARSQGLRGAASMYDFAGATPHLAGDPLPQTPTPATPASPSGPRVPPYGSNFYGPGQGGAASGGGAPAGDRMQVPYNPYPNTTVSGGKGEAKNQPVSLFKTAGYQPGPKGDRSTIPAGKPGTYQGNVYTPPTSTFVQQQRQQMGLPAIPQGNAPPPSAFTTGLTPSQRLEAQKSGQMPRQPPPTRLPVPPPYGASLQDQQTYARVSGQPAPAGQAPRTGTPTPQQTQAPTLGAIPRATAATPQPTSIFAPAAVAHPASAVPQPPVQPQATTLGGAPKPIAVLPTPAKLAPIIKPKPIVPMRAPSGGGNR